MGRPSRSILLVAACLLSGAGCGDNDRNPPTELQVMTYNIHYGDPDPGQIATVICEAGADVVGLQEVDVHWSERSRFADQAADVARACGMEFRYGPIYTLPPLEPGRPPRQFGVAVLSRRPIVAWENHTLTRLSTQAESAAEPMPGFLHATVDVDGTHVDIFVTHLDFRPDPSVRSAQVAEMLTVMGQMMSPTILMGDLNAPPDGAELAPLFARMRDAWAGNVDPGFTFPAVAPARRIDYVFVAGPLVVTTARVLETVASDHRPVLAHLVLEPR
jgi:endonuclease/exonuclease/phosphatase family metal-dependent hydrolase